MIRGKTTCGFAYELDEKAINNMELVDALADAEDDNPIAISRACLLMLGKETRKQLYEQVRTKDGRVPIEDVSNAMLEIFKAFGEQGKNC